MSPVVLVIRRGPGDGLGPREMLDMAMVLATFDCPVEVIFQDQGAAWCALPTGPDGSAWDVSGRMQSLPLYDIEGIFVDQASLSERDLNLHSDCPAQVLDRVSLAARLQQSRLILEA